MTEYKVYARLKGRSGEDESVWGDANQLPATPRTATEAFGTDGRNVQCSCALAGSDEAVGE
jgi:hypothetical protein